MSRRLWLCAVALLVVGCGSNADEPGTDGDTEARETAVSPSEPPSVPLEDPRPLTEQVEAATADFVQRTGVEGDDVSVAVSERVTWRDGSLGCPEEGRVYTQALVDGYRIVLTADGRRAAYHGRTGEPPSFCPRPDPDGAVAAPDE